MSLVSGLGEYFHGFSAGGNGFRLDNIVADVICLKKRVKKIPIFALLIISIIQTPKAFVNSAKLPVIKHDNDDKNAIQRLKYCDDLENIIFNRKDDSK
jgi:hypothetical protein